MWFWEKGNYKRGGLRSRLGFIQQTCKARNLQYEGDIFQLALVNTLYDLGGQSHALLKRDAAGLFDMRPEPLRFTVQSEVWIRGRMPQIPSAGLVDALDRAVI